jgi:hypothetical protein
MSGKQQQEEADGTVQVGDSLASQEPSDLTYKDDKYANPAKTATLVAEAEAINPNLDVGADKLSFHRRQLRKLLCSPASSPSRPEPGTTET